MIEIHPDITQAETPPAPFYTAAETYARARENVFTRSWQYIGPAEWLRGPDSLLPFTLMEGCLDEPLLLVNTEDGLRCLSNVCTHRGAIVVGQPGKASRLQCPYHGRRWGLDGTFQHMPEFTGAKDFPRDCDHLPSYPVREWGGMLFAALEPEMPFEEWIGPVQERVGWMPFNEFRLNTTLARDYLVQANWALYCDNYLEGLHIPFVHPSLNQALDYSSYRTELFGWGNLQVGQSKGGEFTLPIPPGWPGAGEAISAYYFWLFPNIMLNYYPWGLSLNLVRPLGPSLTKVSFLPFVWQPDKLGEGAGKELDKVEREDEVVVESVQRGLRSRTYTRGRYSPTKEQGVHQFHRLLAARL